MNHLPKKGIIVVRLAEHHTPVFYGQVCIDHKYLQKYSMDVLKFFNKNIETP